MTRGPAAGWADAELAALERAGLLRTLEPLEGPQGAVVRVGGRELVNFSSNDYLGLAGNPRLAAAAARAAEAFGSGSGASRLVVGDTMLHRELEHFLARALGVEAALLFNSGYAANVGLVSTLAGPGDLVFSDALNHASLIDGCRLSRARVVVYPHKNVEALDRALEVTDGRRKLVVTDAIFSMDGDRAPLVAIADVCDRRRAALLVDEAHAFGVVGPRGAGLCAELGIADRVDVRMATLGKAAGSYGAFAATSSSVARLLVNRARSFVFSTSLPPPVVAAAAEGARLAFDDEAGRARLWRLIARFADGLIALGFPAAPQSTIFPVVLGTPERALHASRQLRERGLLVKAIRPPTVPAGTSRLRFSLTAAHTEAHVDLALTALRSL